MTHVFTIGTMSFVLLTQAIFLRGFAYAILAPTLMWALDESVPSLEQFFMGLFVFNILHMYLAGAAGYGIYTTIFSRFMNDNMMSYGQHLTLTHLDMAHFNFGEYVGHDFLHSMIMVAIKQVYGYVIWIALALVQQPDVLFLDEPSTFMDIVCQIELLELIKKLNTEKNIGIVAVMHDLSHVLWLSDDVIMMSNGKVVTSGPVDSVMNSENIRDVFNFDCRIENTMKGVFPSIIINENQKRDILE